MKKSSKKAARVNANQPYQIGASYLFRTVTNFIAGRVVAVGRTEIVVADAAWIADTGRFADAVKSGQFSEVEPYPAGIEVVIGRGAVVDAVQITHAGPYQQR